MSSSLTSPCAKEARAQETWAQLQQRARENYYVNRKSRWDPVEWYARQGYNITEMERVGKSNKDTIAKLQRACSVFDF